MTPEDDPTLKAGKRIQNAIDELQVAIDFLPVDHPIRSDLIHLHHLAKGVRRDVGSIWSYYDDRWNRIR